MFPETRLRRFRLNENIRSMVRESRVHVDQLIYPIFVVEGEDQINPIGSMPGINQFSLDHLLEEVERAVSVGIKSIILFGIPAEKDAVGTQAYDDEGIVQKAIRKVRAAYPELVIIADCCLCEYTSHGHCGRCKQFQHRPPSCNLPGTLRESCSGGQCVRAGTGVFPRCS